MRLFLSLAATLFTLATFCQIPGTVDQAFFPLNGVQSYDVRSICIDSNQRIILGGVFAAKTGAHSSFNLLRIEASGNIDPTFSFENAGFSGVRCLENDLHSSYLVLTAEACFRVDSVGQMDPDFTLISLENALPRIERDTEGNIFLANAEQPAEILKFDALGTKNLQFSYSGAAGAAIHDFVLLGEQHLVLAESKGDSSCIRVLDSLGQPVNQLLCRDSIDYNGLSFVSDSTFIVHGFDLKSYRSVAWYVDLSGNILRDIKIEGRVPNSSKLINGNQLWFPNYIPSTGGTGFYHYNLDWQLQEKVEFNTSTLYEPYVALGNLDFELLVNGNIVYPTYTRSVAMVDKNAILDSTITQTVSGNFKDFEKLFPQTDKFYHRHFEYVERYWNNGERDSTFPVMNVKGMGLGTVGVHPVDGMVFTNNLSNRLSVLDHNGLYRNTYYSLANEHPAGALIRGETIFYQTSNKFTNVLTWRKIDRGLRLDPDYQYRVNGGVLDDYDFRSASVSADYSLLIAGSYSSLSKPLVDIHRIDPLGNYDSSFTVITGSRLKIAALYNNKVMVASNSGPRVYYFDSIQRYLPNGLPDETFTVFAPGFEFQFLGCDRNGLAYLYNDSILFRLDSTGAIDPSFQGGEFKWNEIWHRDVELKMAVDSLNRPILFGEFYAYDGIGCHGIVRLNNEGQYVGMQEQAVLSVKKGLHIYPNPNSGSFWVEHESALNGHFEMFDAAGKKVDVELKAGENVLPGIAPGIYIVKSASDGRIWQRLQVE